MKNNLTIILALSVIFFVAAGCGLTDRFTGGSDSGDSSSSSSESGDSKSSSTSSSGEVIKIGITECDELATFINDNSEEIEGSIVAKGIVYLYKNMILENIKEGVEKMSDEDKVKVGKACAKSLEDLKKNLEK